MTASRGVDGFSDSQKVSDCLSRLEEIEKTVVDSGEPKYTIANNHKLCCALATLPMSLIESLNKRLRGPQAFPLYIELAQPCTPVDLASVLVNRAQEVRLWDKDQQRLTELKEEIRAVAFVHLLAQSSNSNSSFPVNSSQNPESELSQETLERALQAQQQRVQELSTQLEEAKDGIKRIERLREESRKRSESSKKEDPERNNQFGACMQRLKAINLEDGYGLYKMHVKAALRLLDPESLCGIHRRYFGPISLEDENSETIIRDIISGMKSNSRVEWLQELQGRVEEEKNLLLGLSSPLCDLGEELLMALAESIGSHWDDVASRAVRYIYPKDEESQKRFMVQLKYASKYETGMDASKRMIGGLTTAMGSTPITIQEMRICLGNAGLSSVAHQRDILGSLANEYLPPRSEGLPLS